MHYLSSCAVERALRCLDRPAASEHVAVEVALCHGVVIAVPNTQRGCGPLSDGYDVIGTNVLLSVAKLAHVLAMKLQACETTHPPHATDLADGAFLIEKMDLNSFASVHARVAPGNVLGDDVWMLVLGMLSTAR